MPLSDIIHATEYLWDVATCLYGEKNKKRTDWMQDKLYALTSRPVGYLIGARKIRVDLYNHRHMMDYAISNVRRNLWLLSQRQ